VSDPGIVSIAPADRLKLLTAIQVGGHAGIIDFTVGSGETRVIHQQC